jgi:hypothetical protein
LWRGEERTEVAVYTARMGIQLILNMCMECNVIVVMLTNREYRSEPELSCSLLCKREIPTVSQTDQG